MSSTPTADSSPHPAAAAQLAPGAVPVADAAPAAADPPAAENAKPPRWRRALRLLALLLALLGWWISRDLLFMSANKPASNPLLQATCDPARSPDCLSVLGSPHAMIRVQTDGTQRAALPWSAVGAGYFSLLAAWLAFVGAPSRGRSGWHTLLTLIVLIGVAFSAYFLHLMANVLGRWCLGCVSVHVLNATLGLLMLLLYPWRQPAVRTPHPSHALAGAALLAGVLSLAYHATWTQAWMIRSEAEQLKDAYEAVVHDPEFVRWHYARQPQRQIPLRSDDASEGPEDAPHTLVAFTDLQCSACRKAHEMLLQMRRTHVGRLRVVYRHYPLSAACNAEYKRISGHEAACQAARAVEAVRLVAGADAALALRARLHELHDQLDSVNFTELAGEFGVAREAFEQALNDPRVAQRIADDVAQAKLLGVSNVPTLFLDGRVLRYWSLPATWDALIAAPAPPATRPVAPSPRE